MICVSKRDLIVNFISLCVIYAVLRDKNMFRFCLVVQLQARVY